MFETETRLTPSKVRKLSMGSRRQWLNASTDGSLKVFHFG